MAKELYLFKPIYPWMAEDLVAKLEEYSREDVVVRVNSPGGSIFTGWSIVAKLQEKTTGTKTAKVDGMAASMAAVLLPYFDKVIAVDTSAIMIHKGSGPTDTPEDVAFLSRVNKDLQSKLNKRVNSEKLKSLKGYTIDELFAKEDVTDIWLTAKEAKQVGLVDEIVKLDPKEIEAVAARADQEYSAIKRYNLAAETETSSSKTMNKTKLKAEHPDLYAEILAEGAKAERSRVKAWAKFADVDKKAVETGIDSGEPIDQVQIIEFMEKRQNAKALGGLKNETEGNTVGGGTAAEEDDKKKEAEANAKNKQEFIANLQAYVGQKY